MSSAETKGLADANGFHERTNGHADESIGRHQDSPSTNGRAESNGFHRDNGTPEESGDDVGRSSVLVTGGTGYIGSHTAVELVNAGYSPVIVDNLSNSNVECIRRLEELTGHQIPFYELDIRDKQALRAVFKKHEFRAVIHFAGFKAVGESCEKPLMYYDNNVVGSVHLFEVMTEYGVHDIIFSSSCTVYGDPRYLPIDEAHPVGNCTNPYGRTKYFIEQILRDICQTDERWNVIALRYFNPIGAHDSGLIGEDPHGPPNCLLPYVAQVAVGRRPELNVYGDDYDTPDGTGVRDYLDVVELAAGHVTALKQVEKRSCRFKVYNLGTGNGHSVLDAVKAFEVASGRKIPYKIVGRRSGDVATVYADVTLAKIELGWKSNRTLNDMCANHWRWQTLNPNGYLKE